MLAIPISPTSLAPHPCKIAASLVNGFIIGARRQPNGNCVGMVTHCLTIIKFNHKVEARPVESVMVSLIHIESRHDASYGMLTSMQSFVFDHVGPIHPSDAMQHVLRDWNDPSPCMFIFLASFIPPITSITRVSK